MYDYVVDVEVVGRGLVCVCIITKLNPKVNTQLSHFNQF